MIRLPGFSARRAAAVVLLSIVPLASAAAQLPARIAVTPCGAADSLFHTTNDDVKGLVRAYRTHGDSTSAYTAPMGISFHVRYAGQRADSMPWSQLTLFLRTGTGTDSLTEGAMPVVTATVNDSTRLDLTPAQVGASRGGTITIPVSAYVSAANLLAIARSRSASFAVGPVVVAFAPEDRRNLRALYHVALCGEGPTH
jgi:hypothetical protein